MADTWKTVETSTKKMPEWVKAASPADCLRITTEAPTLQEAQQMAEREILRALIQAVATNVTFHSSESQDYSNVNDKIDSSEQFSSEYEIAAARLPFIPGVSLSEAKSTWWERRENKQSKQMLYLVTVLYPLPEIQLMDLRHQFKEYDGEKAAKLEHAKAAIEDVNSTDGVEEQIGILTELEEYFFDKVRLRETQAMLKRYRDVYRSVYLAFERTAPDTYRVATVRNGKPFRTGRKLEVTSECASDIKVNPTGEGDAFIIRFSTEDCIDGEANSLQVGMRLGAARLNATLPL